MREEPFLRAYLSRVLRRLGIRNRMHGFRYIMEAVILLMENGDAAFAIVKEVYMGVGERCGASPSQVERAIRTAIGSAWKHGNRDWFHVVLDDAEPNREKPCNSEFLLQLTEYMKLVSGISGQTT